MADAFSKSDTKSLLKFKHIMFLGDSNIRAQYKDLVWLLNSNTLVTHASLRSKLEISYLGDTLIERSKLHHGRDYKEVRQYTDSKTGTVVDFAFLCRCYNSAIRDLFTDIKRGNRPAPDVIVVNSCLWDLTRWGPNGVPEYKDNMVKLMRLLSETLPQRCLVIWTTALPTAPQVRGGLLIKQIEFMEPLLRFEVMEANTFARDVVARHGFDVLDNHYHTRMQMHRRAKDGVHYMPIPVRLMTNLLLTHIALSWGSQLPNNVSSVLLDKAIAKASKPVEQPVTMPSTGIFAKIKLRSPVVSRTKGLKITFDPNQERPARRCKLFQEVLPDYQEPRSVYNYPDFIAQQQSYREPPAYNRFNGPHRRRNKKNNNKRNKPYQEDNRYYYRY